MSWKCTGNVLEMYWKLKTKTAWELFQHINETRTRKKFRQRLHEIGSVWHRCEIGAGKPCVYTVPGRSALARFSNEIPNWFTCESDPVWNCTVPGSESRLVLCPCKPSTIQVNPCQIGSDTNGTEPH